MTPWLPRFCAIFLLLFVAPARAELFASDEVLSVELHGPITETVRDKRNRAERPFRIVANGKSWPVDVRVRGKSRVQECRFRPLRLNFSIDEVAGGPFAGLDKVKLVTHCRDAKHFDTNLFEEYAAYRMFSLLTEFSHRVRLMRIRYFDTAKPGNEPLERYAFALEPVELIARRTGSDVHNAPHVVKARLALEQSALVFVYQYLIANSDWSLVTAQDEEHCCHNGSLLRKDGRDLFVPYDFDLSGLVNARYAVPDKSLRIRTVTSRVYRGYCFDGLDIGAAVDAVMAQEQALMDVVRALPDAGGKESETRLEFLSEFFEEGRAGDLAAYFEANCVG